VPISELLGGTAFDSQEGAVIVEAFEQVLSRLGIVRGSNCPREELVAKHLIAVAKSGVIERRRLVRETLIKMGE
jgi:hypothetical protein